MRYTTNKIMYNSLIYDSLIGRISRRTTITHYARFVFTAVKIQVEVFWVLLSCRALLPCQLYELNLTRFQTLLLFMYISDIFSTSGSPTTLLRAAKWLHIRHDRVQLT